MSKFVLAALLALACVAVSVQAIELSASIDYESFEPAVPTLPVNSKCAESCVSDQACNQDCQSDCGSDQSCLLTCQSACLSSAMQCVRECADNFTAQPELEAAAPRPQPRPHSLNKGYGPETVENWAGYVSVNGSQPHLKRHLWYWFFESRNEPSTDPLILWMTGGPGCSGLVALFRENGPYIIAEDLSLSLNPYSWNSNASVIWIDQPSGSGFSYADSGDVGPFNEAEIANNVYEFLQGFLAQYPKYANLPFYLTGESYAGHYLPSVATRILAGNEDSSLPTIHLQAVAIGNGLVNPLVQYTQYLPFAAANKILPATSLGIMKLGLPACETAIKACSWNTTAGLTACIAATEVCNLSQMIPFQASGLNVYDYRIKCEVPGLCYDFSLVDKFLAQQAVATALGTTGITWQSCNRLVNLELIFAGDWMRDLSLEIPAIIASGVRVVVYSGEDDFICNWYGGLAWTNALVWPGQEAFVNAPNTTWISTDGQDGGSSRTAQGFTFLRVKDAGHMVPLNQPERALDMLSRIISGAPFDGQQNRVMGQKVEEESTVEEVSTEVTPEELLAAEATIDALLIALE